MIFVKYMNKSVCCSSSYRKLFPILSRSNFYSRFYFIVYSGPSVNLVKKWQLKDLSKKKAKMIISKFISPKLYPLLVAKKNKCYITFILSSGSKQRTLLIIWKICGRPKLTIQKTNEYIPRDKYILENILLNFIFWNIYIKRDKNLPFLIYISKYIIYIFDELERK